MPAQQTQLSKPRPFFPRWPAIFSLIALEALAAAVYLAALPADPGGRFLGLSANRLVLIGLLVGFALGFAMLAARMRRLTGITVPRWLLIGLFVLLPLVALACVLAPLTLLSLYRTGGEFRYFAFYERLLPLFAWALLASLEIFVGLARSGMFHGQALRAQRGVFQSALAAWALFGLAALFVALTGIGVVPDRVGWGMPTVSLMEWQIWMGWAAGSAMLVWMIFRGWKARSDWPLAAAIWLLAAGLWLSQPVRPAFFATAGRAPNFEMYPFSDGAYYDHFAQSVLIGDGFKGGEIPARPMYVTLLAGFHLLAGQTYKGVIAVQTLLLAFFPVVLFFLGKALHSRAAGLTIALLAILREVTAIVAMPITDNASNSQLFFADLPAALAVSLLALAVVLWLKAEGHRPLLPFLVGGSLGLAMLFRTQSMFMLPALLLLALFVYRWNWGRWLRAVALLGLGLALTLSPWLLRNLAVTGRLAFDDDKSQTGAMAQRYSLSGTDDSLVYRPGEDPEAYSRRITQSMFGFLATHPDVVAGFVSGHWLNAEIANLLVLPVRGGITGLDELVMPVRPTWQDWSGTLTFWQALLFAANAGLIALGLGASWQRAGWAGLVPLLANLSYNFSNALARNSGGRYLLVVDWVMVLYAALGLMEITIAALGLLGVPPERMVPFLARRGQPEYDRDKSAPRPVRLAPVAVAAGLAFVLVGSLPGLVERVIPPRYPQQARSALLAEALRDENVWQAGVDGAALARFAGQAEVLVVKGRALYPRYYDRGQGEPRTAKTGYEPLDYARTVFVVASPAYNGLAILKAQAMPGYFPNTADVLIIGCSGGNYLDARLVVVLDGDGAAYTADAGFADRCPIEAVTGQ